MRELLDRIKQLSEEQSQEALQYLYLTSLGEPIQLRDALEEVLSSFTKKQQEKVTEIHLVFGLSAGGGLSIAFPEGKVIALGDNLAIGPLSDIPSLEGLKRREEWLGGILDTEDYLRFSLQWENVLLALETIPSTFPIYIWAGEHAGEQIAKQLFVKLLAGKENPIFVIDSTCVYRRLFDTADIQTLSIYTGEMSIDQLKEIKSSGLFKELTKTERRDIEKNWVRFSQTQSYVRLFENGVIQEFDETALDSFIVEVVKEQSKYDSFVKAARIVGEVYGRKGYQLGDSFIESRLLRLIMTGVLEMQGSPKEMRRYSVRLKHV